MSATNFFTATALPALGELGTPPPLSLPELRAWLAFDSAAPLIDAVLLGDDLRQRQALLAGELNDAAPAVLEVAQIKGQTPLPDVLTRADAPRNPDDALWESYWYHVADVAAQRRSAFLHAWIGVEVALRNALAAARARSFGQPAAALVLAASLGEDEPLVALGVAAWAGAADPLTGLRALLRTRWDWVTREEPYFGFSDDELAAYAVKLILLRDWRRTMGAAA